MASVELDNRANAEAGREQWPVVSSVHVGYLTLAQAAHYLGVSTATIRRWIASSALPHYHILGAGGQRGKLLFRQGEIDRWMRRFHNGLAEHIEATVPANAETKGSL